MLMFLGALNLFGAGMVFGFGLDSLHKRETGAGLRDMFLALCGICLAVMHNWGAGFRKDH